MNDESRFVGNDTDFSAIRGRGRREREFEVTLYDDGELLIEIKDYDGSAMFTFKRDEFVELMRRLKIMEAKL